MEGVDAMNRSIRISSVSKSFGAIRALDDVSLEVTPGEILALLGHNGAGKTTLFRILLGFIAADRGEAFVAESYAGSRSARQSISYLPESVAFPKNLTGLEIVQFYATLKGGSRNEAMPALDRVGLADAARRRCGTYSKGMRQRLGLAQAIVGDPKILLLDEPTSGLDPISRGAFYDLIATLAKNGTTVLLSSHGLSELEARTGRIAILRQGRLVADGPLAALQREANLPTRIRIQATQADADTLHKEIGGRRINGAVVELTCTLGEKMGLLRTIHASTANIRDVEVVQPSLDEVYRHYSETVPDGKARS